MATGPKEISLCAQSNWGHSSFSTFEYCNGVGGNPGAEAVVPNQRKPEYIVKKYKQAPGRTQWILSVSSFSNEQTGRKRL